MPGSGVGDTHLPHGKGWNESTHLCLSFPSSWAEPSEGGMRGGTLIMTTPHSAQWEPCLHL